MGLRVFLLFILFCIINEISFTIISLSSSDKFFLESRFFIRNYYYITNYHRNLLCSWTFISLQIKEFRIMGLSINDSVYSCLFFFLTGLHFFHLLLGVLL